MTLLTFYAAHFIKAASLDRPRLIFLTFYMLRRDQLAKSTLVRHNKSNVLPSEHHKMVYRATQLLAPWTDFQVNG